MHKVFLPPSSAVKHVYLCSRRTTVRIKEGVVLQIDAADNYSSEIYSEYDATPVVMIYLYHRQ